MEWRSLENTEYLLTGVMTEKGSPEGMGSGSGGDRVSGRYLSTHQRHIASINRHLVRTNQYPS